LFEVVGLVTGRVWTLEMLEGRRQNPVENMKCMGASLRADLRVLQNL
jgi:hypothetical protein